MSSDQSTAERSVSLSVPCELLSVTLARQRLAQHLGELGCPEPQVRDAATVLSELLMNAIVHGVPDTEGRVDVSWEVDPARTVTIAVHDEGQHGAPRLGDPAEHEGGGRGLLLVDRLSDDWTVQAPSGGAGTTVTASLTPA